MNRFFARLFVVVFALVVGISATVLMLSIMIDGADVAILYAKDRKNGYTQDSWYDPRWYISPTRKLLFATFADTSFHDSKNGIGEPIVVREDKMFGKTFWTRVSEDGR
jgi:hypothetical protein